MAHDRKGLFITTFTGKKFRLETPSPDEVYIEDIAHHLSLLCRWTGAVREFYSVAQHSVHVSRLCPPEYALAGLLHDAGEAYVGDLSSPVRKFLLPDIGHSSDFDMLESSVLNVVYAKYGIPREHFQKIKAADELAWKIEVRDLIAHDFGIDLSGLDVHKKIDPYSPEDAKWLFLRRFYELTGAK